MSHDPAVHGIQLSRILDGDKHASVVYFLTAPHMQREAVKIGTSTRLAARITGVSYAATFADVLLLLPGGLETEATWHREFSEYRVQGFRELFWLEGRLKAFLDWPAGHAWLTVPAPVSESPRGGLISLAEAVKRGVTPGATLQALRMDRHRSDKGEFPDGLKFPEPGGRDGAQKELFWSAELAEFNAARRGSRL